MLATLHGEMDPNVLGGASGDTLPISLSPRLLPLLPLLTGGIRRSAQNLGVEVLYTHRSLGVGVNPS